MLISEIYKSINGEGRFAGFPTSIVRVAGCNLNCSWCDTTYALTGGERLPIDEIMSKIREFNTSRVLITGGEPLLQEETGELARRLLEIGYHTLVETNGSLPIDALPEGVFRCVDIKTPSSGESGKNLLENIDYLLHTDDVKFVIADRDDFNWSINFTRRFNLISRCDVLFSPVWGRLPPDTLARWILDSGMDIRLNLQLHKLIWKDREEGRK